MNLDAMNAAMNPAEITYSNDVFGQIEFDIWFCVLKKGVGKAEYDETQHRPGERRTAIDINIADIGGNNYTRSFIAEINTDGWQGVTLPSLANLGVTDLTQLHGAYIHAEMVKFATYKKADGTEGVKTAPKIVAIYKSREECEAAAQAGNNSGPDWLVGQNGANGTNGAPASDAEKQVALAFLPAIVKSCVEGNGVNSVKLDAAIKSNPILAKHFNIGSPEVMSAITAALAEPAF